MNVFVCVYMHDAHAGACVYMLADTVATPPIEAFMFLLHPIVLFFFFKKGFTGTRLFDFPFSESGMVKQ